MGYSDCLWNVFYWLFVAVLVLHLMTLSQHFAYRDFLDSKYIASKPPRCNIGHCVKSILAVETLMRSKAHKILPFDVQSFFQKEKWNKKLVKRSRVLRKLDKIFRSYPNGTGLPYIGISQERPRYSEERTREDPDDCTIVKSLPKGSLKLTALYSAYGSGSTWLRYLVELATGICTGSHYRDNDDYMAGFFGEAVNPLERKCILIKTAGPNVTRAFKWGTFEEAIILLRNPYDAILSSFYKRNFDKNRFINDSHFETEEWSTFATVASSKWFFGAIGTCQTIRPSLTVFYEDLVNDTEHHLRRILNFLGVQPSEKRIKCAIDHSDRVFKKYHRKGNLTFDPYTKDLKERVNGRIKSLRRQLAIGNCGDVPKYEIDIDAEG